MKPVMLVILDGWGEGPDAPDNAVARARTPRFDRLRATCPHALLATSGHDVGLPEGQMGNSEVGHLNIGAGRVVMQDLVRIDLACRDRAALAQMPPLRAFVRALRDTGGTAHLLGLVSEGGVHAHQAHAAALARALAEAGIPVALHAFTDGRDAPPRSAPGFLAKLEAELPPGARIATVTGRYFAMDRDNRWERVERAWRAIALGEGERAATALAALEAAHARDVTDEFVPATVLPGHAGIRDGDGLLCFNFRADRAREILAALLDPSFDGFPRPAPPRLAAALGMTQYSEHLDRCGLATLFPPQSMRGLLGEVVAAAGRTQLRMAETEKYPHVTYFLNGGNEAVLPGEHRILVPSPKVATYDLQPAMSAPELARKAVDAIATGPHDLIVLNFANADMVGHTGSLDAATRAVEAVDEALGRVADAVAARGGALLVTADHGNAEQMRDALTGQPHTAHTTNPVPVVLMGGPPGAKLREGGRLADLAPTLLALMGLDQPPEMTGKNLLA
jgi:2,3-bisphosphoglycerate-independent phosphoglycerate mutase